MQTQSSPSELFGAKKIAAINAAIEQSEHIIITTHLSPDGDALGSSLALYHFLKNRGKNVEVLVPNSFPYFLKWMQEAKEIVIFEYIPDAAKAKIAHADLIFCLDYNVLKRIGDMGESVQRSDATKILIDHHLNPGNSFHIVVSHPEISSTSEMIFRFLYESDNFDAIDKTIAECIYCGMMTDTGAFTYNSNSPEIFEIVSLLLKKGVDKDAIFSNVFNNYSENRFRLLGFTLSERMRVFPAHRAALIYLSREDQAPFSFNKGDTEGFVNYPLNIRNIIFSVFIREDEKLVKVSLRSQGDFPCNQFAAEYFNGGGHLNASGGEYYGSMAEAITLFERGLEKYKERLNATDI